MALTTIGDTSVVWGVTEPLPLKGFPKGRVKLRLRSDDFARAFVKTEQGTRSFFVAKQDGYWIPKYELGINYKEDVS